MQTSRHANIMVYVLAFISRSCAPAHVLLLEEPPEPISAREVWVSQLRSARTFCNLNGHQHRGLFGY